MAETSIAQRAQRRDTFSRAPASWDEGHGFIALLCVSYDHTSIALGSRMPCYAVLGATGNTGRALVQVLLDRADAYIHAYCRSQEKLLRHCPATADPQRVSVFEGRLDNGDLIDQCLRRTDAVFLVVAVVDNMPGCTVSMDTAQAVVASLQRLKSASPAVRLPQLVMLSSASLEESFCGDVPAAVHWVLKTAVSHLYQDLAAAESFLRAQSSWLSTTFVKPGGLVHDMARGHEICLDKAQTPLSFLDLAGGMVEVANAADGRYDMRNVSVIPKAGGSKFPWDGIYYTFTGLLFHYFPWTYAYIGEYAWPLGQRSN
ncbi:hypothetical protein PHISP_00395 [Aspergillus sp. HF37]|nr:hypothetical protein PHISP_00395 [Aspergillus sp. HF37]